MRKKATEMFELAFLFYAYVSTNNKDFFYIQVEGAFSVVQIAVPIFLDFIFHNNLELRVKCGGFVMDESPRGSVNEPVDRAQNRAFCYRLPALYKLFRLLFECSDSTCVFTSLL